MVARSAGPEHRNRRHREGARYVRVTRGVVVLEWNETPATPSKHPQTIRLGVRFVSTCASYQKSRHIHWFQCGTVLDYLD